MANEPSGLHRALSPFRFSPPKRDLQADP
jgi:hypothetical protein